MVGRTPERKIRDICLNAETSTELGDTFYLITQRWWQDWLRYANRSPNDGSVQVHQKTPSSIDNSDLMDEAASDEGAELREDLVEGADYILLPECVWKQLHSWGSGSTRSWEPYGMPLVSPISSDNTVTRSEIQMIVRKLLSPMSRTKESGAVMVINDTLGTDAKLSVQLVDEDSACIDLTVDDEKVVKLSSSSTPILVYVDWSMRLLECYNTTCIETSLPEVCKYVHINKKPRNEPLSLYACLEAFLRQEPLVPDEMWLCPQCKGRRQASKKLDLWRLPEVLVIHLKRFSYRRSTKHKLGTYVDFPIHDLDLTNYVAKNNSNESRQVYELYALINHYGNMGFGHYTAHIKLSGENKWFNFDDIHVTAITEDAVKSAAAYVLFYRKVDSDSSLTKKCIA